jgi:SSS family transporter
MSLIDWVVMLLTLGAMTGYGIYKGRGQQGAQSYLLAGRQMPWYVVLLGVMATQASAITFLSAPGLAYNDGMRFVQNYFGLPLAMVVICITFVPVFSRLKVYTAYEYLEQRFDRRTRLLTSFLFLLSRGLSTGISIYAPAIILSSVLGWNVYLTNVIMGGVLLVYTLTGGAKAVAHTQKLQFIIILGAMALAGVLVVRNMPAGVGVADALYLAGQGGRMNIITTEFNWHDKYNIWSGVIGGFFLALSYFGTDHSQVGRYISASTVRESRLGLLLNGLVKVPMQLMILLIGVLVFVLYSFREVPAYFNTSALAAYEAQQPEEARPLQERWAGLQAQSNQQATQLLQAHRQGDAPTTQQTSAAWSATRQQMQLLRDTVAQRIVAGHYAPDKSDTNYIFLHFVQHTLPRGLVGLLFAVIILASWGSISAALNSLAASSLMDIHLAGKPAGNNRELKLGRLHTLGWGLFCIGVAMFAAQMGSLIEAVNILGSLFYGTILGIFLVGFYYKKAGGKEVFAAAVITEVVVVIVWWCNWVSFLWLNVIGALLVVILAAVGAWWRGGKLDAS